MERGERRTIGKGRYRDRYGITVRVRVNGEKEERRFPLDTPADDMKAWQDETRARLRLPKSATSKHSLSAAIDRYYQIVHASPDRKRELEKWRSALGTMEKGKIAPTHISEQLEAWRKELGWSASTLNHHRTALSHLYRRLDGRGAANPVREVPRYAEPDAAPRGLSWPVIRTILRNMEPSTTRLRIALIATTGLPHGILGQLRREDVDWRHRTYRHPGRKKGKGAIGKTLPLSRRAAWYFRLLDWAGGWGPFSRSSLHKSFRLACKKAGDELKMDLSRVRPYDCRHSFAIAVLNASHSLQAVSTLLAHKSVKTTMRYTRAVVDADAAAAISQMEKCNTRVQHPTK